MRRRHVTRMLAAAAAGLVVAGCGVATPASPSAAQTAERLTPRQIVAQASTTLAHMHSLQVVFSGQKPGYPRITLSLAVQLPGRMSMSVAQGRLSVAVELVGHDFYAQGSQRFWAGLPATARAAPLLADRWIGEPANTNPEGVVLGKLTRQRTLAGCFSLGKQGALSYDGTSLVDGISTVVVRDRGNRPGDAPTLMYISATAPYLLLREVQTGPSLPGGGSNASCRLSPPGVQSAAGAELAGRFHLPRAGITVNFSGYDSTQIFSPGDALMVHPRPNSGGGAIAAGSAAA